MEQKGLAMEESRMPLVIRRKAYNLTTSNRTPTSSAFTSVNSLLWSGSMIFFVLVLLLSPVSTFATVSILVSEDDMVQHATAIVVGQVRAIESYWDTHAGQIFTHITVIPTEVLKGEIAEEAFTIKQLGGTVGQMRSWVDGAPEFSVGERVLLFLATNPDGSTSVAHFYQGKFSLFSDSVTGKEFAFRGATPEGVHVLAGARDARAQAVSAMNDSYEMAALKARIQETLRTSSREQRASSVPLATLPIPLASASEKLDDFVVIGFPLIRWFEPDSGLPVLMSINPNNLFPNGEEQVDAAFQAWNTARQSTFRFQKGLTTTSGGFAADGVNAISFNDPLSQLPDPQNCTGILAAVLYVTISDESRTLHEQTFIRILEADLIFANGWDNCVAYRSQANVAEVATHELGHVLGLGHSSNPEATMFAFAHFDGRGAALHPDDGQGVAFLYPDDSFPPCTYRISPAKRTISGEGTIAGKAVVSTRNGCGWTAVSTVPWITIIEGGTNSEAGTIRYVVNGNSERTARQGAILVAGKRLNIKQKRFSSPSSPRRPPFSR